MSDGIRDAEGKRASWLQGDEQNPVQRDVEKEIDRAVHAVYLKYGNNLDAFVEDMNLCLSRRSAEDATVLATCESVDPFAERTSESVPSAPEGKPYPAAGLYARIADLESGIRRFIRDRGIHNEDHIFCCANGRCLKCEESYIIAEGKLDELLNDERCWICWRMKGQPPERCSGHYEPIPIPETPQPSVEQASGERP